MRFIHVGAQTLLALAALFSSVATFPAGEERLTADDAAYQTLSQRDVYIAADGMHSIFEVINQIKTKFHSPWVSDALSALSGRDFDNDSQLAKRDGPPTEADFQNFFASEPQKSKMKSMVFWSGTDIVDSQKFADSVSRNTLEMVLGENWKYYQTLQKDDGYWSNMGAAVDGFWKLASKACAAASTGEVYVLLTPERDAAQQQQDPNKPCTTCWYQQEKPLLIVGLHEGRVSKITKYLTTSNGESVGQINTIADKM